jgi:hypothetical protein
VSTRSNQITAAIAARRDKVEAMLVRVRDTINQLHRDHAPVTVQAVSRRASVSRAFLYQNLEARALVAAAVTAATEQHQQRGQVADRAVEMAWRERALNAEDALKLANREIGVQRIRIGELLGRIRDLELDLPADAVQRLATENTTLKQQNRTLTTENNTLGGRLAAARGNNRSLERKVSELQAQILDRPDTRHLRSVPPSPTPRT